MTAVPSKSRLADIQVAIDAGTITESVVLDLWAAYEAMQQERDEAREALWTLTDAIDAMGQIAAAFKHARAALSASSTPDKTQTTTKTS